MRTNLEVVLDPGKLHLVESVPVRQSAVVHQGEDLPTHS